MKKKYLLVAGVAALLVVGVGAWAASEGPGSEADPVVSKSYVDAKASFAPVLLGEGQKLLGSEGAEIILRSGEAFAIDNGENGVSDLTSGKDLMSGDQVALNHLLLVPRADGRGIMALTEAWVMVKGIYDIQ
ncbi:MAG: hypothetical protein FWG42_04350 [Clostridiales bacterium]|nr:hypothetical protein [Clostridiales bacterium]